MPWLRTDAVDIGKYLPDFLQSEEDFRNVLTVESSEHERQRLIIADLLDQMFLFTETWALSRWESILQIAPKAGATYEERRHEILLKLCGRQTSTVRFMEWLVNQYTDIRTGSKILEDNANYRFTVQIEGLIADKPGLKKALETYKPAHLGYGFLYHVTDKDLHDEPRISGEEFLAGISSWFLDVVPYGRAKNHLHYDGKWQYASPLTYSDFIYGGERAYGDIIKPGTVQYEPFTDWRFVFDGLAQYDGTWQYDGSYIYNGERPWVILYNDFMDELSVLVITMSRPDGSTELQDDIAALIAYGELVPYGARQIGVNRLPTDNGGELTILKGHTYGAGRRYDYGVSTTYGGGLTYATMKFEGGETYGPRRYTAVL